ncbi:MAG: hypothetical protein LBG84_07710 [Treponema sp.]|jgi:hypothetical protein|nr:hypothetical protein [Treponema sp.]
MTSARRQKPSFRGIGQENESGLHRALKFFYAEPGRTEETLDGFVCDAIGPGGEAVEIQTGNFSALKNKVPLLAARGKVRLIYPVIVNKNIELYDAEGNLLSRRKSPRKGTAWDIFNELIYAPGLVGLPGLTVEIALVDATERRRDDGKGSWRRKGISIEDRILDSWREGVVLEKKSHWLRFLPLEGEFTAKTMAPAARISPVLARKTLYVLEKAGLVEKPRKEGRSWVYRTAGKKPPSPAKRRGKKPPPRARPAD